MLREIAEYPNSFGPLGPDDERIETSRYTLCLGAGKTWNTVQRQRFSAEEVDEVLAEVRARLRERGRTSTQWEVGSSASPPGLVDLLLERGLVRDRDPFAVALVLTREPPPTARRLVARRVETFEEFAAATAVQWVAFESTEAQIEEARLLLEQRWQRDFSGPSISTSGHATRPETVNVMHGVWLDGELVCTGTSALTEHGLLLYGGATRPDARGRGAYRALLRARWDEAAARGTPALFTQGGSMSRPILERLGFEPVGHVHMLVDNLATNGS
jgi:GNAT superfamily N-acetyltransferase